MNEDLYERINELSRVNLQFERDAIALVLRELSAIARRLERIETAIQTGAQTNE